MMPVMLGNDPKRAVYVFGAFAFMMVLQLIWVWWKMPETKGVSLEDLEKQLIKK